jgi:hypothetical protein
LKISRQNKASRNLGQTETSNLKNVDEAKEFRKSTLNNNDNISRVLNQPMEGNITNDELAKDDKMLQKPAYELKNVPESHKKSSNQQYNNVLRNTPTTPNGTKYFYPSLLVPTE